MTPANPIYEALTSIVPILIAVTFHEVAHGLVANRFGDPTAKEAGRLSLNPLRHVDLVGTILLPVSLAIAGAPIFGWAKPVPVRTDRLRNPRWQGVLVSAAGPAMNFLLALIGAALLAILLQITPGERGTGLLFLLVNLDVFVMVNLFLGTFNLLPIPPLDGGRVLEGLLPPAAGRRFREFGRYGFALLLFLLVGLPMLWPSLDIVGQVVQPPVRALSSALFHLFMIR